MRKKYKTIGCFLLIGILSFYIIITYIRDGKSEIAYDNEDMFVSEEIELKDKKIVVEIKGEVKNPNIYWLEQGSIVDDLISKAGGLTKEANVSSINRAQELVNHQSIVIPNVNDKTQLPAENSDKGNGRVNINTANESELDTLPGIGPSRAKDIITYREKVGMFKSIEEIKNVKGIGEAAFEKMKEIITI